MFESLDKLNSFVNSRKSVLRFQDAIPDKKTQETFESISRSLDAVRVKLEKYLESQKLGPKFDEIFEELLETCDEQVNAVFEHGGVKRLFELSLKSKVERRNMLFALLHYQMRWDFNKILIFWNICLGPSGRAKFGLADTVSMWTVRQAAMTRGPKAWERFNVQIR